MVFAFNTIICFSPEWILLDVTSYVCRRKNAEFSSGVVISCRVTICYEGKWKIQLNIGEFGWAFTLKVFRERRVLLNRVVFWGHKFERFSAHQRSKIKSSNDSDLLWRKKPCDYLTDKKWNWSRKLSLPSRMRYIIF